MISLKTRIKIEIAIIGLLLFLIMAIYINGQKISCDACVVEFKEDKALQPDFQNTYSFKALGLYEAYINNSCPITWDRTNGYFKYS